MYAFIRHLELFEYDIVLKSGKQMETESVFQAQRITVFVSWPVTIDGISHPLLSNKCIIRDVNLIHNNCFPFSQFFFKFA